VRISFSLTQSTRRVSCRRTNAETTARSLTINVELEPTNGVGVCESSMVMSFQLDIDSTVIGSSNLSFTIMVELLVCRGRAVNAFQDGEQDDRTVNRDQVLGKEHAE
jgi:hypothetical protein